MEGGLGGRATDESRGYQEALPAPRRRMIRLEAGGWVPAPVVRAAPPATPAGYRADRRADHPPKEGAGPHGGLWSPSWHDGDHSHS
jgi:hypothetical protein